MLLLHKSSNTACGSGLSGTQSRHNIQQLHVQLSALFFSSNLCHSLLYVSGTTMYSARQYNTSLLDVLPSSFEFSLSKPSHRTTDNSHSSPKPLFLGSLCPSFGWWEIHNSLAMDLPNGNPPRPTARGRLAPRLRWQEIRILPSSLLSLHCPSHAGR